MDSALHSSLPELLFCFWVLFQYGKFLPNCLQICLTIYWVTRIISERQPNGVVSERFKVQSWKGCVGESLPRVRIPATPPFEYSALSIDRAFSLSLLICFSAVIKRTLSCRTHIDASDPPANKESAPALYMFPCLSRLVFSVSVYASLCMVQIPITLCCVFCRKCRNNSHCTL